MEIDTSKLVSGLVGNVDALAASIVAPNEQIEKRVEIAGPPVTAPLGRARQSDFE